MYLGLSGLQNTLSFFVKLIGFRGDRTRGVNYLVDCMNYQKGPRASYSGLLLALYTIEIDKDMSTSYKYL